MTEQKFSLGFVEEFGFMLMASKTCNMRTLFINLFDSPTAAAAAVQAADGMAVVVDQAVSTSEGFLF